MNSKKYGNWGESFASNFLKEKGYKVVDRNFRTKYGEIDIVAVYQGVLVFVEVKTRFTKKYGKPEEAVTPAKIKKIVKVGEYYSQRHPEFPKKVRIDVVAIEVENHSVCSVRLIRAV